MAFQRAILPAVLSWADKLVMIGKYWNTYLIACQCYILLYRLYGRTIVILLALLIDFHRLLKVAHHVRGGLGGMDDVFGGIDDALR